MIIIFSFAFDEFELGYWMNERCIIHLCHIKYKYEEAEGYRSAVLS